MKNKTRGISMVEIIVSMVILALIMVGMINVFVVGKTYTRGSGSRVSGGELGKFLLDPFQTDVREDQWNNTSVNYRLSLGNHPEETKTINGITYTYTWNVTDVTFDNTNTTVRRVIMNVNWTE